MNAPALACIVVLAAGCAKHESRSVVESAAPIARRDFADITCDAFLPDAEATALGVAKVERRGGRDDEHAYACSLDLKDANGTMLAEVDLARYLHAPASLTAGVFVSTARTLHPARAPVELDLVSAHPTTDQFSAIEFSRGPADEDRVYAMVVADRGVFVKLEISTFSPWWRERATRALPVVEALLARTLAR